MTRRLNQNIKRIEQLLSNRFDNISKRPETLLFFKSYLEANLKFPIHITGIEDFDWEEFYLLGPGSKQEYETLKKNRPSYSDIFNMIRIDPYFDEDFGLFTKVTRLSDKKRFQLPLADMKAVNEKSPEYQLLQDYSVWFINY
jgi:hypothetical protein